MKITNLYLTTVCVCTRTYFNTHLLSCCHTIPKSLTLQCRYIMKHSQILITTSHLNNDTNPVCFLNRSTPEILFLYSLSDSNSDKNFEMQMLSKECQLENYFCNSKSI